MNSTLQAYKIIYILGSTFPFYLGKERVEDLVIGQNRVGGNPEQEIL